MKTKTAADCAGRRKRSSGQKRKVLRRTELVQIAATIDPLLHKVLGLIGEERAIPVDLFSPLLKASPADIDSVLAEGAARGLLLHRPYLWLEEQQRPEPAWYWMTRKGLHIAGLRGSYNFTPSEKERWHARGVLKIRLDCATKWPKREWLSERTIVDLFGRASRSPHDRNHAVDGALRCGNGTLIGIEYERTEKDTYRIRENMEKVLDRFGSGYFICSEVTRGRVEHVKRANGFSKIRVFREPTFPGIV